MGPGAAASGPTRRAAAATRIPTPSSSRRGRPDPPVLARRRLQPRVLDLGRRRDVDAGRDAHPRCPRQRPYVKVASDGIETIHMASPTGTRARRRLSLYYARYTAGKWFRADGRRIGSPPFAPADADRVWDVTARRPARLGARRRLRRGRAPAHRLRGLPLADRPPLPPRALDRQRLAATGRSRAAGASSRRRRASEQYSGGIVLDHADPAVVYLSRAGRGAVADRALADARRRRAWTHRSLTEGSREQNVRPVVARGGGPLWLRGPYVNYRRYRTVVVTD